jgi:hypothetical protein
MAIVNAGPRACSTRSGSGLFYLRIKFVSMTTASKGNSVIVLREGRRLLDCSRIKMPLGAVASYKIFYRK